MVAPFVMGIFGSAITGAVIVLIVLTVFKHASTESRRRHEAFTAALEKGYYDPTLLGKVRGKGGTAALGWGFVFTAIGLALFIGFAVMGILGEALLGALIPLFMGLALVLYHRVRKSLAARTEANGKPVRIPTAGSASGASGI